MTSDDSQVAARSRFNSAPGQRRALGIAVVVGLLAIVSAWLMTPFTSAYIGQPSQRIVLTGPSGTIPCSSTATVKATVTDLTNGQRVSDQFVHWSVKSSPSSQDAVDPARTTTDANGKTSTHVTFGQVSGPRKIQAYSAQKRFPGTITITCHADAPTPPPTAKPTPNPTPKPTPRPTAKPTKTPRPTKTPEPGQSGEPAQSTDPGQSGEPAESGVPSAVPPTDSFLPTPIASSAPAGGSPTPPLTGVVEPGTTPAPTAAPNAGTGSSSGGGGVPPVVVLLGGLGILAVAALLLWSFARRRRTSGPPPA